MPTEEAKQEIQRLIAKYVGLSAGDIKRYNEANTRKDFILPLFKALGWDVYSREEVTEEEKVSRGRVDYAFRIKGIPTPKFFLEAKPLRADLDNPDYAKQVINYAYHKGVTWAVLTDFEGIKVFNAEWKGIDIARAPHLELSWQQYLEGFDRLWLLSREAFEEGLLDKEAEGWGIKFKKTPVGQQLFSDLVAWRGQLHKHLADSNRDYTVDQIDEAVQRILDRLIFIRTCEDRDIEPRLLLPLVRGCQEDKRKDFSRELRKIWKRFEDEYDSRLFEEHFSDQLKFASRPFEQVIEGLYEARDLTIEYDFNAIDADVLGGIYEQYLENLLKRAGEEVEVIPERGKRKAHGIYYTPKFVVRYIVENTLGRALDGKSLNDARKIRILDPACGSGSFLVEALDYLERHWRRQGWVPEGGEQADFFDSLTRVQFLTDNLFGVDLDAQAVEIAQLNLLLKSVHQRALLPDLKNNIRQGNSLISGTEAELRRYFGDNWEEKHSFNWEEQFDKIKPEGRFDVVIGNPPYVRIQSLPREDADYYRNCYKSAFGSFDIYVLFLEKAVELLKPGGRLGFITSGKFLKAEYGKRIQQVLHENCTIENIVDLSSQHVFADATTYPVVMVLKKEATKEQLINYIFAPERLQVSEAIQPIEIAKFSQVQIDQEAILEGLWPPKIEGQNIMDKLFAKALPLKKVAERIFQGLVTGADDVFIVELIKQSENPCIVRNQRDGKSYNIETSLLHPLLKGSRHIRRYYFEDSMLRIIFPYEREVEGSQSLITVAKFRNSYPEAWKYLQFKRKLLEAREHGKWHHDRWYSFGRIQNLNRFGVHEPHIITPAIAKRASFCLDKEGCYFFVGSGGGGGGGYGITLKQEFGLSLYYILALLNSKVSDYCLHQTNSPFRGGYFAYNRQYIELLPIRCIDFENPEEKKMHDKLVALVERMLELNKRLAPIRNTPCNEQDELQREVERTDGKIDNLVYDLYGLTEEEREIVDKETESGGS